MLQRVGKDSVPTAFERLGTVLIKDIEVICFGTRVGSDHFTGQIYIVVVKSQSIVINQTVTGYENTVIISQH